MLGQQIFSSPYSCFWCHPSCYLLDKWRVTKVTQNHRLIFCGGSQLEKLVSGRPVIFSGHFFDEKTYFAQYSTYHPVYFGVLLRLQQQPPLLRHRARQLNDVLVQPCCLCPLFVLVDQRPRATVNAVYS